jgi:hypothetical protein
MITPGETKGRSPQRNGGQAALPLLRRKACGDLIFETECEMITPVGEWIVHHFISIPRSGKLVEGSRTPKRSGWCRNCISVRIVCDCARMQKQNIRFVKHTISTKPFLNIIDRYRLASL